MKYTLPDGQVIDIKDPSKMSSEQRSHFYQTLQKHYPDADPYEADRTAFGQLWNTAKGVPGGALETGLSGIQGVLGLALPDEGAIQQGISSLRETVTEPFRPDDMYRDTWLTKLGWGGGSYAAMALGFKAANPAVTRQMSKSKFFNKKKGFGTGKTWFSPDKTTRQFWGQATAIGAPFGLGQQFMLREQAREKGEDVTYMDQMLGNLAGIPLGATEMLPLERLLKGIPKSYADALGYDAGGITRLITRALKAGTAEGIQEVTAGLGHNLAAKGLYDPDLPISDSVWDDFTIGGTLGFGLSAAMDLAFNRRTVSNSAFRDQEGETRKREAKSRFAKENEPRDKIHQMLPDLSGQNPPSIQTTQGFNSATVDPSGARGPESYAETIADEAANYFPVGEIFKAVFNQKTGKFNVLDSQGARWGVESEDADVSARIAGELTKQSTQRQINKDIYDALYYSEGVTNEPRKWILGSRLRNPGYYLIPAQTIANNDSDLDYRTYPKDEPRRAIGAGVIKRAFPIWQKKMRRKGRKVKRLYTPAEAKKLLSKKDFNQMMSQRAQITSTFVRQEIEKLEAGKRSDKRRLEIEGGENYTPNKNTLQEIADSKNIILDTDSEAFKYFAGLHTGTRDWKNMTNGQKQLLMARFDSLPFFPSPTKLPLLRPRKFNREQFDAAYALIADTGRANPNFISKELGIPRDAAAEILNDLTESGRIIPTSKTKADVVPIEEWTATRRAQQAIDITDEPTAVRYKNESIQEFIDRTIADTGKSPFTSNVAIRRAATPEEVAVIEAEAAREEVPEATLTKAMNAFSARLEKLGMGDLNMEFIKHFTDPETGEITMDEARYNEDLQKIILSLDIASDGGRLGEAETINNMLSHMDHEIVHAMRNLDLINEQEWNELRRFVMRAEVPKAFADARGDQWIKGETWFRRAERINTDPKTGKLYTIGNEIMGTEDIVEEAVAEAFRAYELNSSFIKEKAPKTIWEKIKNFLRELFNNLAYGGFRRPADIFSDLSEGIIGKRERGEIRTLRELDYMQGRAERGLIEPTRARQTPVAQELAERLQEAPPTFEGVKPTAAQEAAVERASVSVPGSAVYLSAKGKSYMNLGESEFADLDKMRPIFGGIREGTLGAGQADFVSVMGTYDDASRTFLDDNAEAIQALNQELIRRSLDTERLELAGRALVSVYADELDFKSTNEYGYPDDSMLFDRLSQTYVTLSELIKRDASLASLMLTMQSIEEGTPMPTIRYYTPEIQEADEMLMRKIAHRFQQEDSAWVGKDGYGMVASITGRVIHKRTGGRQVRAIDSFVETLVENIDSYIATRQFNPRTKLSNRVNLLVTKQAMQSGGYHRAVNNSANFVRSFIYRSGADLVDFQPSDDPSAFVNGTAKAIMRAMFSHQIYPGSNYNSTGTYTLPVLFEDRIFFANFIANYKKSGIPDEFINQFDFIIDNDTQAASGVYYSQDGTVNTQSGLENPNGMIGMNGIRMGVLSSKDSADVGGTVETIDAMEDPVYKELGVKIKQEERRVHWGKKRVDPSTTEITENGTFTITPSNTMAAFGGTPYHEFGHAIDNFFRWSNHELDFLSHSSPYFGIDMDALYELDTKKIQLNPLEGGKIERIEFKGQTIGIPKIKLASGQEYWFRGLGSRIGEKTGSIIYETDIIGMDESALGPILNEALNFYNIYKGTLYGDTDIAKMEKNLETKSLAAPDLRELGVETQFPFTRFPRSKVFSQNSLSQALEYPLLNLRALVGIMNADEVAEFRKVGVNMYQLEYVQTELFAQLFDLYTRFPQLLENELPITYDVFSKLGEILSHAQATRLSPSELIKPVQDVFRVTSATQRGENRISWADRFPDSDSVGRERSSRRVARAISSTNRLNIRKIPENLIRERDTIGEISDAEAKLHTGYPEATEETPSLREGDIVRTRQRRSHAESMEFAQEAYAVTQSAVQNYPRKVLETYNKNVGLPQYRKKAKQVAKPKIQTRISEVYDRLQDTTASTYKETALERKIFESYKRPLRNVFNLLNINNYREMVEASYNQLAVEVRAQYQALLDAELDVEFHEGSEEYLNSGEMLADVQLFNHLWVFQGGTPSVLLSNVDGDGLTDNDKFRAVHDYFGHAVNGSSFGPSGEEDAWDSHTRTLSPLATIALTTETRAQNSWVNYSGMNDELNDLRRITANLRAKSEQLSKQGNHEAAAELYLKAEELGEEIRSQWVYPQQKSVALPIEYTQPGFRRNLRVAFPLKLERASRKAPPPEEGEISEIGEAGVIGLKGEIEQELDEVFAERPLGTIGPDDWKEIAGAPKAENAPSYSELSAIVQMGLDNNVDQFFYEKFGFNSSQIVGNANMFEFSSMFGITSENTPPEQNLSYALQAMIIARKTDPLKRDGKTLNPEYMAELRSKQYGMNLTNSQTERMAKIYRDGHFSRVGDFHKTPIYARTIEAMASANNELVPYMTGDRWMARGMGFGIDATSMSPTNLRVANYLMSKLAQEEYTTPDGMSTLLTIPQVQSLLWYQFRTGTNLPDVPRTYTEGNWESAENRAKGHITEINNMKQRGEWVADAPLKKIFPKGQISWTQANKTNNFSTKVGGQLAQIQLARMPTQYVGLTSGATRGHRYDNLTEQQRRQLSFAMADAVTNSNKNLRFLSDLSIPHNFVINYGMYGIPEFNIQLQMYGSREEIDTVSKVMGDAMLQDSMVTTSFDPEGQRNAVQIFKEDGSEWTRPEMRALAPELSPFTYETDDGTVAAGLSASTDGKRLLVIDPKALVLKDDYTDDLFRDFSDRIGEITDRYGYNGMNVATRSELYEHQKGDYQGAIERLSFRGLALGRPNLQRTALNNLYLPAWQAYTNFGGTIGATAKNNIPPWEDSNTALGKPLVDSVEALELREKQKEHIQKTPVGAIPRIGLGPSTLALNTYFELETGKTVADLSDRERERSSRSTAAPVSPDIQARMDAIAPNYTPNETMGETMLRVAEMGPIKKWFTEQRANWIERYARIEQISREMEESLGIQMLADTSAYASTLFADRARGIYSAMLRFGSPIYEEGMTKVIKIKVTPEEAEKHGLPVGTEVGGLIDIFKPLYNREGGNLEEIYKYYSIVQRGKRLSEKKDKEGNFIVVPTTQEDANNLLALEIKYPELKKVYAQYQLWNNRLIDFATKAGLLNEATGEMWKDFADYYPFYRQFEGDDEMRGPRIFSGIVGANIGKELKGGEDPINVPMLDAVLKNALALTTASMKNIAAQKVIRDAVALNYAKPVPNTAKGYTIVRIKVDGNDAAYHIEDPLLYKAMQAFGDSEMGGIMNVLAIPSRVLREAVTRDPGFILVNLMRDTMSAFVTSGADYVPIIDTAKGFFSPLSDLEMLGVVGGYDFAADPRDAVKFFKQIYNKLGIDIEGGYRGPTTFWKMWDGLGRVTTRSDAATRRAVYNVVLRETGNEAEAAFQALEIINFGRRGGHPLMRIITAGIPFMNARIQGLDVLYRAGMGRYSAKRTDLTKAEDAVLTRGTINFLMRGAFLALLTSLYYALVSDDDEYKNVRQEVRDDNWIIPIFKGFSIKIPIPFEVGAIFKVIPERLASVLFGDGDANSVLNSFSRQFWVTFEMNPLDIQAIGPLIHALNNKNSFTGNDIVPFYMETGLEPSEQFQQGTNELAIQLGRALNISPLKIEYIMRGYGGTLGAYLLNITDYTLKGLTGKDYIPRRFESGLADAVAGQLAGRFYIDPRRTGGLQQQYYELRTETRTAVQTFNKLRKEGRIDEASAYFRARPDLFKMKSMVNAIDQYLEKFRQRRLAIQISDDLSPEMKQELIQQMELERDRYLMVVPNLKEQANIPTRWVDIITPPTF
jgi:hypothetical protein